LARRGATLIIGDINLSGAQDVARTITASGGRAFAARVDVRQAGDVQALVDQVVEHHGRLDLIFNNAGIGVGGEFQDFSLEHWRTAVEVNLMGVIHGVAAAYPVMVRHGGGQIVNIASLAGLIPSPGLGPYAATKGAVVSLTHALRLEGAFGASERGLSGIRGYRHLRECHRGEVRQKDLLDRIGLPVIPGERRCLRDSARHGANHAVSCSAERAFAAADKILPVALAPFQRLDHPEAS
jgi:hypothetical protein